IPIVATAESQQEADQLLEAGATSCIATTEDPGVICESIRRHLEPSDSAHQAPREAPKDVIRDPRRLETLESTELLDAESSPHLDDLTGMVSQLLAAPVALVSLVDDDRQFFTSHLGLPEPWSEDPETPLSHSFCQWVVSGREMLVTGDARKHPVLRTNKAIEDLGVIAYVGAPVFADNEALGSLCAIDSQPREWNPRELHILDNMVKIVEAELLVSGAKAKRSGLLGRIREVGWGVRAATRVLKTESPSLSTDQQAALVNIMDRHCGYLTGEPSAEVSPPREA
ncbi:MAG: GAF domain-containing protein, partial [Longimicrobiales bacterium]|nr:GAF domain-containing protein [Longimicrobiales bacterium]